MFMYTKVAYATHHAKKLQAKRRMEVKEEKNVHRIYARVLCKNRRERKGKKKWNSQTIQAIKYKYRNVERHT